MILCGHYHAEDKTCALDANNEVCREVECPFGLYDMEEPDCDDMFESSKCILEIDHEKGISSFSCTMPEWV